MSLFYIKCECGNKISKFVWNQKLEKTKDGKFLEDIKTCKNCGAKYIKINPFSFFITAWNILLTIPLSVFVTYQLMDYIEIIKFTNFFYIVVFVFFVIFTILFFVIDHSYYKKYLEKE